MSNVLNFIENIFSKPKKEANFASTPHNLLQLVDFEGIYHYFYENVKYYSSIQNSIEGFNRELSKPNWVVAMCEDFHEKINHYRSYHSKPPVSLNDVFDKEDLASMQSDYLLKLAIHCTELCLK